GADSSGSQELFINQSHIPNRIIMKVGHESQMFSKCFLRNKIGLDLLGHTSSQVLDFFHFLFIRCLFPFLSHSSPHLSSSLDLPATNSFCFVRVSIKSKFLSLFFGRSILIFAKRLDHRSTICLPA